LLHSYTNATAIAIVENTVHMYKVPRQRDCGATMGIIAGRRIRRRYLLTVRSADIYCQTVQTITENSLLPVAFRS